MKQQVIVIGLGRFGSAVARELQALGHEVLAVDADERTVNAVAPDVTHALQLDASDEEALRAAGAAEFPTAVVAISSDMEASIFATMALKNLGVPNVISKAGSALHGTILERVGADRVVYPEREMGIEVARTFDVPNALDYLEIAPGLGIEKLRAPARLVGKSLRELDVGGSLQITPVAIRRGTSVLVDPGPDERIAAGDELVVLGRQEQLEKLRD